MKILQIASCFPAWGGTELHVLNLSERLVRRGHDVTITCRPGRFVEQEAHKRGLRTIPIMVAYENDWTAFGPYLHLLRKETFDIAHVHWATDYIIGPTVAKLRGIPVVLSHHSPAPLPIRIGDGLTPDTLYRRVIALSEWVRGNLIDTGLRPEQVLTIHHGTDVEAFARYEHPPEEVRASWRVEPGTFVAAFVGQVGRYKGAHVFVEALRLLKEHPEAPLITGVIVGDGPALREVREQAKEAGLTERDLVFAGFTANVADVMHALEVLVLPSTWPEPCAAVIQQAMAAGKPVIGTRTGGTPEMVVDGETGMIIPSADASALCNALISVAQLSPKARIAMGEAGQRRVAAHFTLEAMVDRVEAVYRDTLRKPVDADALYSA